LAFNPADNLGFVEDQFAAGPEPEVWKPYADELLSYGPRRAADQVGYSANVQRSA
jgi:hypothetical protein